MLSLLLTEVNTTYKWTSAALKNGTNSTLNAKF